MKAVDGAYVDDARGLLKLARRSQQWHQFLDQEKCTLDVEIENLVPAGLGKGIDGAAPSGAGVVDQYIQFFFACQQLSGDALCPCIGGLGVRDLPGHLRQDGLLSIPAFYDRPQGLLMRHRESGDRSGIDWSVRSSNPPVPLIALGRRPVPPLRIHS